jgi:hypothetical protein
MDISEFYTADLHAEGAEVRIKNPLTGKLTDCYIKVVGMDSKAFRVADSKGKRSLLSAAAGGGDIEQAKLDAIAQTLADSTIGWRGFTDNGKELEFSIDKAVALYANSPVIANQVDIFISNRRNFIKG